jgi:hypothetical protein
MQMKQKLIALRLKRGEKIALMEANVACSNEQETGAYNAAKAEVEALAAKITDLETMAQIVDVLHVGEAFLSANCERSLAEFRTLAIDEQARIGYAAAGDIRHVHAEIRRDEREGLIGRMSEGLASRYTGRAPSDGAREYVGARVADLAREICRMNGLRATGYGAENSVRLAMGTSDFPELLQGTGRRILLAAYEAAQPAIKQVARRSTAQDFRTKALLRLGEAPQLELVPEGGEIKQGNRVESKESYRIYEYAKIYALSRQAICNDDLGAWSDYISGYGVASATLEGQKLAELLLTNTGLGPVLGDGVPLFDASAHKNYLATGTTITIEDLGIARTAMRVQTGLDGRTIINVAPKYLVTSAAKETLAEQYLAQLAAATAADANPFTNKLTLVVVPEFDAAGAPTNWLLFGDPGIAPVLEYSWLEGNEGPQVEIRAGWETLGVEYRCVMSWGCGVVGFRGVYKNVGA